MITFQNIKKSFPGMFKPVLNNFNLTIQKGDFCILVGANGSGKSTLLKLINGDYVPDSGQILCQEKVAQVFQNVNLGTVPQMTLLENMALSEMKPPKLLFYQRHRKTILKKLKELNFGLEAHLDQPLERLSGGQKQIIATLMALNSRRNILLLDEHTSALDPNMQKILMDYTHEETIKQKLTTIMITHKMDQAIQYGNRLLMLHEGKIVFDRRGKDKAKLVLSDLISLFHQYQEKTLVSTKEK